MRIERHEVTKVHLKLLLLLLRLHLGRLFRYAAGGAVEDDDEAAGLHRFYVCDARDCDDDVLSTLKMFPTQRKNCNWATIGWVSITGPILNF